MLTKQSPKQSSSDPLDKPTLDNLVRDIMKVPYSKHKAKKAILDWHLQKCRSYLLEVIGEDDRY